MYKFLSLSYLTETYVFLSRNNIAKREDFQTDCLWWASSGLVCIQTTVKVRGPSGVDRRDSRTKASGLPLRTVCSEGFQSAWTNRQPCLVVGQQALGFWVLNLPTSTQTTELAPHPEELCCSSTWAHCPQVLQVWTPCASEQKTTTREVSLYSSSPCMCPALGQRQTPMSCVPSQQNLLRKALLQAEKSLNLKNLR